MRADAAVSEEAAVRELSEFAAAIRYERLPPDVALHAKYVWLDTLGVILAGSAEPYVRRLTARMRRDDGTVTILGAECPRAERGAAVLVNGTAGTVLELDEGHRPTGHPAIYVIPALLAAAEEAVSSGRELVASLVAGYEVGARLASAATLRSDVHVHGAVGPSAAAAAVSHLRGEDPASMAESIRVGATLGLAAPFRAAFEGALVRNAYAGVAGVLGLTSHDLVRAGLGGYTGAVADTFGTILGESFSTRALVSGLGDRHMILTNYFKRHAACRYTHSALDAVEQAVGPRALDPNEIDGVVVECDSNAARCDRPDPQNALAAKFSLPFAIATRLVNGSTDADAFRDEVTANADVRRVAGRVSLVAVPPARAHEEWAVYPAKVEIRLAGGARLLGEVTRPHGDQPDPLSLKDVEGKFLGLTSRVLPSTRSEQVRDFVLRLERTTVADLVDALRRPGGSKVEAARSND